MRLEEYALLMKFKLVLAELGSISGALNHKVQLGSHCVVL